MCGWRILRRSEISRRTFSLMSRLRILLRFRILIATLWPVISCSATATSGRQSQERECVYETARSCVSVALRTRCVLLRCVTEQRSKWWTASRARRSVTAVAHSRASHQDARSCHSHTTTRGCYAKRAASVQQTARTFDFAERADAERLAEAVVPDLDRDVAHCSVSCGFAQRVSTCGCVCVCMCACVTTTAVASAAAGASRCSSVRRVLLPGVRPSARCLLLASLWYCARREASRGLWLGFRVFITL